MSEEESNIIEVDFKQDTFDSDLEDAFNGVADVVFEHFEEAQARSLLNGISKSLLFVSEQIGEMAKAEIVEEGPPPS